MESSTDEAVRERLALNLGEFFAPELEANKKLHDEGQKYTTLLGKVVPLRAQVVGLQEEVAANKVKMATFEERSVLRKVHLGRVEAELIEKAKPSRRQRKSLLKRSDPGAGEAGRAEAPTLAVASSRIDKTSTNLARFSVFSTMPAPRKEEIRTK
ncbi:hypothetical protein ACSQ67_025185 [Phaseolus vulgaris]